MFHKVKSVSALQNFCLSVQFCEGVTKLYDMKPVFEKMPFFAELKEDPELFFAVYVDVGGYGIVWNDELDLSCDELWEHGEHRGPSCAQRKIGCGVGTVGGADASDSAAHQCRARPGGDGDRVLVLAGMGLLPCNRDPLYVCVSAR